MQNIIKSDILLVRILKCGSCDNDLKHIRVGAQSKIINFPANAVLIRHKRGNLLFDTGYTRRIYECGFVGSVYNHLNPAHCTQDDEAITQLEKMGITKDQIKTIILSHLHPDHIGGLKDFPNSAFLTSSSCISLCRKPSIRDLVFKPLIPDDFFDRAVDMESNLKTREDDLLGVCYDVFGDGEILLKEVGGHADGQIMMYLPKLKMLFAADMCWNMELAKYIPEMKKVARFIQHNYDHDRQSASELLALQAKGISIYPSHQSFDKEVLYENE